MILKVVKINAIILMYLPEILKHLSNVFFFTLVF